MPENLLGMQISNFRYANMDFFKTPHIQIRFLGENPVFKYEFLVLFSHPCFRSPSKMGTVDYFKAFWSFQSILIQGSFDKNSTVRDCATIFALSLMTRWLFELCMIKIRITLPGDPSMFFLPEFCHSYIPSQLSAGVQSLQQHPGGWPSGRCNWCLCWCWCFLLGFFALKD